MSKTLYITEKPKQVGFLKAVIKDPNAMYYPLAGHILSALEPEEYDSDFGKKWYEIYNSGKLPLIPSEYKKKVTPKKKYRTADGKTGVTDYPAKFEEVKAAIKECDQIIIASDPDNEGANLALEVIKKCNAEKKVIGMVNMSKLDPISLASALKDIKTIPYNTMSDAADARAIFDWLFGMNLTIAATVLLGQGKTIHMGGVKLPVIRMVVERDLAFETFKEIPFWTIKAIAKDPKTNKEFPVTIKYKGEEKFDKEDAAKKALEQLAKSFKIDNYAETMKASIPPLLFSLTDLAAEAAKLYKFPIKMTENLAQALYEKQIQSYPRTEENYIALGQYVEVAPTVSHLQKISDFAALPPLAKPYLKRRVFSDKELDGKAHTALTPTMKGIDINNLSDEERKIYLLVAKRYYSQFMPDYEYLNISLKTNQNDFEISANDNIEVSLGWKELGGSDRYSNQREIPVLAKGDQLTLVSVELKKGSTKPKERFTETSLLKGMERISSIYDDEEVKEHLKANGIGTPATRGTIIQDLFNDKGKDGKKIEPYFIKDKGKVISTKKARDTIAILSDNLTSPILRANLEAMTKDIVKGNITLKDAVKEIEKNIRNMHQDIVNIATKNNLKAYDKGSSTVPSLKQIEFAQKVASNLGVKLSQDILEDRTKISEWLEGQKNNIKYTFSEKQMEIVKKITTPTVVAIANKTSFSKEEYDLIQGEIKKMFDNFSYKLSEKQRAILENPDNKITPAITKLISAKTEYNKEEWEKINTAIKKVFNTPKGGAKKAPEKEKTATKGKRRSS